MKDLSKLFGIIFVAAIIVSTMAACDFLDFSSISGGSGSNPDPISPAIPPTAVTGITVTTPPTKIQYNLGEELDTTGMVVTAAYSDGSTVAVTGYAVSGYDKTTLGNKTVIVTYSGKNAEFTVNVIDPTRQTVATPTLSVAAGTYNVAQSVALSCTTENATIYYTTDGSNPTETSNKYSGVISIGATITLKAFAVKEGMNDSGILTAAYTMQALKPTVDIAAGVVQQGTEITLATPTEGAEIWYTTNGNTPAKNGAGSTKYTVKITINETITIKAIAVKDGWSDSEIMTIAYTVQTVATPTANPAAGAIQKGTDVTLATATEGAEIWYTTNNSAPAKNGVGSTKYNVKITINATTTIKAIAVKDGWGDSEILSAAYTVQAGTQSDTTYIITGSGTSFTATNDGASNKSGTIQDVIDSIRTHATGKNPTIQFGNGTTTLDIGTETASINNSGGQWSAVKLTGKITSTGWNKSTIYIDDSVSVTCEADIANKSVEYGLAIVQHSIGTLSITGGTVSATDGWAVCNASTGTVTITGGTVSTTSRNCASVINESGGTVSITGGMITATSGVAVSNHSTGMVSIVGGTISTASGIAVGNYSTDSTGTVSITGGTVSASATDGKAVYNSDRGSVSITGGTVSATSGTAMYNASYGTITVSGTAKVTSASGDAIYLTAEQNTYTKRTLLEITGGTVENTDTGDAVCIGSNCVVNITGGTISAKSGRAVSNLSYSKIDVSGTAMITSASTKGTIFLGRANVINDDRLEITGGTVENTSTTTGYAIYDKSAANVIIIGGTVSKAGDGNYAVYKEGPGLVYIGADATIVGNVTQS
jgi:hypothetical protein